jgi:hypothetical protein
MLFGVAVSPNFERRLAAPRVSAARRPAHGARRAQAQPRVDAPRVERVRAAGEPPRRLAFLDGAQAHRALRRGGAGAHEAGKPRDGGVVEARGAAATALVIAACARGEVVVVDVDAEGGEQVVRVEHRGVPQEDDEGGEGRELEGHADAVVLAGDVRRSGGSRHC